MDYIKAWITQMHGLHNSMDYTKAWFYNSMVFTTVWFSQQHGFHKSVGFTKGWRQMLCRENLLLEHKNITTKKTITQQPCSLPHALPLHVHNYGVKQGKGPYVVSL
jgi:hypothetical protein